MEKTAKEVFNEIQTTIASLRAQLDELEEKLALMAAAEPEAPVAPEPEPKELEIAEGIEPVESEDLEARSADGGISRRAEREERCDDRKAPAESEAEAACPSGQMRSSGGEESEPRSDDGSMSIDLSIDMEAMGAKTVPDAKNFQWMIDLPGSPVANVISAISLNDRVLFINTLFKEDPSLFQQTIGAFNGMETISEAVSYVIANFPDWNLNSEVVYRLMMAVRRKLK